MLKERKSLCIIANSRVLQLNFVVVLSWFGVHGPRKSTGIPSTYGVPGLILRRQPTFHVRQVKSQGIRLMQGESLNKIIDCLGPETDFAVHCTTTLLVISILRVFDRLSVHHTVRISILMVSKLSADFEEGDAKNRNFRESWISVDSLYSLSKLDMDSSLLIQVLCFPPSSCTRMAR